MNFVLINNELINQEDAKISINQRSCMFGDGIFETCQISNGFIYNFKAHQSRIKDGLKALKFSAKINDLEERSLSLIKKNQIKNGILRISISRGIGSLGYLPTYESDSLIVIQTSQVRKSPDRKVKIGVGKIRKSHNSSLPLSCKTMQALPFTLNKIEAQENNLFDCIMLSQDGFISETSAANIFWIKNKKIFTSSEKCDILLGTIRRKILDNFDVSQVEAEIKELEQADEFFLTNVSGLALAVDDLIVKNKLFSFENNITQKILNWLEKDVANFNSSKT